MLKRLVQLTGVLCLAFMAVTPAQGAGAGEKASGARASGCGRASYSYAGIQSNDTAHGVAATLVQAKAPSVIDGHVGGWIGVGGTMAGPNGVPEWLQVGYAAFDDGPNSEMYYEVTVPGADPKYHLLDGNVQAGATHRVAVLEMANRKAWWRVWVDDRPVSPPIHLPGSHGTWYPQALAENWAGGTGACNAYSYRFRDVTLAAANGGSWKPLESIEVLADRGYKVVPTSATPRGFVATNLTL